MTEITVMSRVAGQVAAGAAFMDEHDPGWWRPDVDRAVDLRSLNMGYGDACVLGQRCPLEALISYLGRAPEDIDDQDFRYHAYANRLNGGFGNREARETWAVAHGFNRPFGYGGDAYDELTDEWARVIAERRAAA